MIEMLRSTLELCVIIPGLLIAYFPVKSSARQSLPKLISYIVPLFLILSIGGGVLCYTYRILTMPILALITLLAMVVYMKTLKISVWKSVAIGLSVCAVFACLKSVSRAINAAILTDLPNAQMDPWLSAGGHLLQCTLLDIRGVCLVSGDSCRSKNGGRR